ncbi:hypothetical protein [Streptomyces sp. NPDC007905]
MTRSAECGSVVAGRAPRRDRTGMRLRAPEGVAHPHPSETEELQS